MKYARFYSALLIFGIFGFISVLADVDSIWKILGIPSPINFTHVEGRNFHTALLFIMYACVFSIAVTAFASRSTIFQRRLDISVEGDYRGISTPVWRPVSNNYSVNINSKWNRYKKVRAR